MSATAIEFGKRIKARSTYIPKPAKAARIADDLREIVNCPKNAARMAEFRLLRSRWHFANKRGEPHTIQHGIRYGNMHFPLGWKLQCGDTTYNVTNIFTTVERTKGL